MLHKSPVLDFVAFAMARSPVKVEGSQTGGDVTDMRDSLRLSVHSLLCFTLRVGIAE